MDPLTGQHPPLMILSKERASGIPFGVLGIFENETSEPSDSLVASVLPDLPDSMDPFIEAREPDTWSGRR
jgi:hypothetical protein